MAGSQIFHLLNCGNSFHLLEYATVKRMFIPAALLAALFLASCSQEPEKVKVVRTPMYIGKVDHVYKNYKYVLIRLFGAAPETGTTLISQPPDGDTNTRIANLVVTAERLGKLRVPADIRSGSVEEGDIVFLYRNLSEPESQEQSDKEKKNGENSLNQIDSPPAFPHPGDEGLVHLPAYDPMPSKEAPPESSLPEKTAPEQNPEPSPDVKKQMTDDLGDLPSRIEEEFDSQPSIPRS